MKIRHQFAFLISGVVVMPMLVFACAFTILKISQGPETKVPNYEEISRITGAVIDKKDWDEVVHFIAHRPSSLAFIVVDSNSAMVFSTFKDLKTGTDFSNMSLNDFITHAAPTYLFQVESVGKGFVVITGMSKEAKRGLDPKQVFVYTMLAMLATLFAFSAIMSILIASSITKSVTTLEGATKKLAAGELGEEIVVKGGNEITSLTKSLNRMRLSLKDENNKKSIFIMGITHDIKTPLALIKGYSEAIEDGISDDPEATKKSLAIIGAKVDQLEGLLDDLIDFVKLNSTEWREKLQPSPLAPLLHDAVRRYRADAALLNRQVESSIDIPADLRIPLDERLFSRALENIVTNALRYTAQGGLVRIDAHTVAKGIELSVTDSGMGIATEDLPHIFELFYRGTGSRREQGMGLGLSVVKNVVDSHGWTIAVESEKGRGSTFRITIPISA